MKYDRNNNPIYRDAFGRRIHNGDTLASPTNKASEIKVVKGWDAENGIIDYYDGKTGNSLSKYNLPTLVIIKSKSISRRRGAYAEK